jgi:FtsP/CotA-like multicopper oxidase with cupredoxin domain
MANRRDLLKWGLFSGAASLLTGKRALAQLCPPDSGVPGTTPGAPIIPPSPPTTPFVAPLFLPPLLQPVPSLSPPPDPSAHQLYNQYPPQLFYEQYVQQVPHTFHPQFAPSTIWTFDGTFPGSTIFATYGVPILVRRYNNLPQNAIGFGSPYITTHLHNFHSAAESDGNPAGGRFFGPGTYWDYHYAMFPAGLDPNERMNQLWYHDHMVGFTAANVYKGLLGCFYIRDDQDTGNENDKSSTAWRLPSGKYDVALKVIDMVFDQNGQLLFDNFNTDGILGDKFVVNGIIQPYFQVEARKYRFRLLNAGPSRFHDFYIGTDPVNPNEGINFVVLSNDGNFLPAPRTVNHLPAGPADRYDIIVDFSQFPVGTSLYLQNRQLQTDPRGPDLPLTTLNPGTSLMRFDIVPPTGPDNSQIPSTLRPLPSIAMSEVVAQRTFEFDYDGGLWTINGKVFDMNTPFVTVTQGTAEIWTIRGSGNLWSHPVHIHFEEFQILSLNGQPLSPGDIDYQARKDVMRLMPNDEIVVFLRFRDFLGSYVMHCHNIFHEDHAMMWRWDIVPPS